MPQTIREILFPKAKQVRKNEAEIHNLQREIARTNGRPTDELMKLVSEMLRELADDAPN